MRANVLILIAASAAGLMGCKASSLPDGGAPSLDLCGLTCPPDTTDGGGGTDTTDGGGTDTIGGNDGDLSSGDTTLAFNKGVLVSPSGGSLSKLTKPAKGQARFEIDTRSDDNENWPETTTLDENISPDNPTNPFPPPVELGARAYKEYANTDLQLQVWDFQNSYATQYRVISGGLGDRQAFSFGGKATAQMPTTGSATFNGSYGSTAEGKNFVEPNPDDPVEAISPNGVFSSNGSARITANFGNGQVNGTLTPETWRWRNDGGEWEHYDVATGAWSQADGDNPAPNDVISPGYFRSNIQLKGTITGKTYTGTAQVDDFLKVTDKNQMHGGFFGQNGRNPRETTGIFTVLTGGYDPKGGDFPAADNGKGTLQHSGVFNAQ